jgi:hypothetical protein
MELYTSIILSTSLFPVFIMVILKSPSFKRLRLLPMVLIGLRDLIRIHIVTANKNGIAISELINRTGLFL